MWISIFPVKSLVLVCIFPLSMWVYFPLNILIKFSTEGETSHCLTYDSLVQAYRFLKALSKFPLVSVKPGFSSLASWRWWEFCSRNSSRGQRTVGACGGYVCCVHFCWSWEAANVVSSSWVSLVFATLSPLPCPANTLLKFLSLCSIKFRRRFKMVAGYSLVVSTSLIYIMTSVH